MNQKTAAQATGLRPAHLSNIERGQTLPTLEVFFRLAQTYGMTPATLLAGLTPGHDQDLLGTWSRLRQPDRKALGQLLSTLHRFASLTHLLDMDVAKG